MKKVSQILAILAAVVITDAHWAVMQSITWVDMVSGTSGDDVPMAILEAISGERPCVKCCLIQQERESEQERQLEIVSKSGTIAPLHNSRIVVPRPLSTKAIFHPWEFHYSYSEISGIDHPPQV